MKHCVLDVLGSSLNTLSRGSASGSGLSTMTTSSSSYVQRSQGNITTHSRYDTVEKTSSYSTNAPRKEFATIDANRVRAQGEGLSRAYRNEKATFTVDTREGGMYFALFSFFFLSRLNSVLPILLQETLC